MQRLFTLTALLVLSLLSGYSVLADSCFSALGSDSSNRLNQFTPDDWVNFLVFESPLMAKELRNKILYLLLVACEPVSIEQIAEWADASFEQVEPFFDHFDFLLVQIEPIEHPRFILKESGFKSYLKSEVASQLSGITQAEANQIICSKALAKIFQASGLSGLTIKP